LGDEQLDQGIVDTFVSHDSVAGMLLPAQIRGSLVEFCATVGASSVNVHGEACL